MLSSSSSTMSSEDELRREIDHFIDHEMDLDALLRQRMLADYDAKVIAAFKGRLHQLAKDIALNMLEESTRNEAPTSHFDDDKGSPASDGTTKLRPWLKRLIDEADRLVAEVNGRLTAQICKLCTRYLEYPRKEWVKLMEHAEYHSGLRRPECKEGRSEFPAQAELKPPPVMRVIDIEATCNEPQQRVVLLDYWAHEHVRRGGYTAISHSDGKDVYNIFNCSCATKCCSTARPRCWGKPCPHLELPTSDDSMKHKAVMGDILRMCAILKDAGVVYAWHDGVCIAQHDEQYELKETIQHMGGVYANARETIIFLRYVGNPIAPINVDIRRLANESRWETRVWTLQEAALSQNRRYCVRVGKTGLTPFGSEQIWSLEEFEGRIVQWNEEEYSRIDVVDEQSFFLMLTEVARVLYPLFLDVCATLLADLCRIPESEWMCLKSCFVMWSKAFVSYICVTSLLEALIDTCMHIPSIEQAIRFCSERESEHMGDRINSILALAEVKGFTVPKDDNIEASTLEFYERLGRHGMQMALFSINSSFKAKDRRYLVDVRQHTWLPILWRQLARVSIDTKSNICFRVLKNGRLELTGVKFLCVEAKFVVELGVLNVDEDDDGDALNHLTNALKNMDVPDGEMTDLVMELTQMNARSTKLRARVELPSASAASCKKKMAYVGKATFPAEEDISEGILIDGRLVTKGETFQAHLVLPMVGKTMQEELSRLQSKEFDAEEWPFLVVQGDLWRPYVAKIGRFKPAQLFVKFCLARKLVGISLLDQLTLF